MAATINFYHAFKKNLTNGTIDLDTDTFRVALYKTITGVSDADLSVRSSISGNEVANGNGYTTYGKSLGVLSLQTLGRGPLSGT